MGSDRSAKPAEALERLANEIARGSPGFAARIRDAIPQLLDHPDDVVQAICDSVARLAAVEGPGRDAAQALLALPAQEVATIGAAGLEEWIAAAEELARVSPRAASAFAVESLRSLTRSGAVRTSLREAAAAVARLAARHGSDPGVLRFAAAAGGVLATRTGAVVTAWAPLWEKWGAGPRPPLDLIGSLPDEPALVDAQLVRLLDLACAAADRNAARAVLQSGAAVLAGLPPALRGEALDTLRLLVRSPEDLSSALAVMGPVVRGIPPSARAPVLAHTRTIAAEMPAAAVRFLRSALRVGEAVGFEADLTAFVHKGLDLGAERPAAALAFFALESRGALAFLRRHDAAVPLEEVETALRGYLQLAAGVRLLLVAREGAGLFPTIEIDPRVAPVAERATIFPTWEENFTLLKLQATLAALWREHGTLDFDLAVWLERAGELDRAKPESSPDSKAGLYELYLRFAVPEAAAGMFAHIEAARLAPLLARRFPGLAADLEPLRRRMFRDDRPGAALGAPGTIVFLALGGAAERVEWADPWGPSLRRFAEAAARGDATVYDSADETARICERLAAGELLRVADLDAWMEDDPLLAYLLDENGDERAGPASDGEGPSELARDAERVRGERSDETSPGFATDEALLRAYLEQNPELKVMRSEEELDAVGLFVAGLTGGAGTADPSRTPRTATDPIHLSRSRHGTQTRGVYLHDEWDYQIADYRSQWCRVHEIAVEGDSGEFFTRTLSDCAEMLPEVRRHFQKVKPEGYRIIRGLLDGEDFDLNAVVLARGDLRARHESSPKLYTARQREERDVATLFLLDMSASTDEEVPGEEAPPPAPTTSAEPPRRRVIDIQKEALVIMSQALEEIGDLFAIYGFSGHGRDLVEFFDVKSFEEPLSLAVRGRIGAIEPQRSTRMGAAIRQAMTKLRAQPSRAKHLILLSDGFPQDFDYGDDRRSNVYGLRDTAMALREAQRGGVATFCITVDRAGNDYLREMCDERSYLVIDDIRSLPHELPKIYSQTTRGA